VSQFNKYYQDELFFLREMGREFARAYPAVAPMLADRGSDPDVERLMEGFAFLTGRIRQKLDDEFPELVQGMMNLLWPHYLRPVPSMSILEFTPITGAVRARQGVSRGVEVLSTPVEGTPCRFQTVFDVDLYPLAIEETSLETGNDGRSLLRLQFKMHQGVPVNQAGIESLRLHLFGDSSFSLYLWLCHQVSELRVIPFYQGKSGPGLTLSKEVIRPVGFKQDESLLPYPSISFDGYRLLQEYFTFPEKFLFIDLCDLKSLSRLSAADSFEIQIFFSKPPAASMRVSRENLRLYCTPVVNVFTGESDPVRVTHERVEYRLRPGGNNAQHFEIFSVDAAKGWVRGSAAEVEYPSFYKFNHGAVSSEAKSSFYQIRLKEAVIGKGTETYVSFVNQEQKSITPPTETVVFSLHLTNRDLAGKLRPGDIQTPSESSPEFARFQNISKVTPSVTPPLGGGLYWKLISHLCLNYVSLTDIQSFRGILELYNFQSLTDKQAGRANDRRIEGIEKIDSEINDHLFRGSPVRGTAINLLMKEDHFNGEGDLFLFSTLLNEFFALYASLNSFTRLTVRGMGHGEIYQWEPKIGQQILL
jgi:type VI secretion system protein ImpG